MFVRLHPFYLLVTVALLLLFCCCSLILWCFGFCNCDCNFLHHVALFLQFLLLLLSQLLLSFVCPHLGCNIVCEMCRHNVSTTQADCIGFFPGLLQFNAGRRYLVTNLYLYLPALLLSLIHVYVIHNNYTGQQSFTK